MKNYLLDSYNLSKCEMLQSLFVSEYGLRHWAHSKKQTPYKWGHRIIAVIELCPLIGLIATIIESLVANRIRPNNVEPRSYTKPSSPTSLTKKRQWLFRGTQAECNGPVSVAKVESIRAKLEAHRSIGIQFNRKKVAPSLEGGTCTAMSLEFLDSYFQAKKISIEKPSTQSDMLVDRILKPANNEKLEEHGHSLVYIKERGLGLFYDPNYGVRNLSTSEHSKILFEGFKSCFQTFQINKARFYRFQPT